MRVIEELWKGMCRYSNNGGCSFVYAKQSIFDCANHGRFHRRNREVTIV